MTTFTYPKTVNLTACATTIGSPLMSVAASAAGSWACVIGTVVSHANIPNETTIIGFNAPTQVALSANATATGTGLTVAAVNPDVINIDQVALVMKAGGDVYNLNGVSLFIDQDSRYGLNAYTASVHGSITPSATLGGSVFIDARKVRLIPFDTGSGIVPASGTVISQGGASGKLIGVWEAINVAPTAAGAAMPATGFVKIKAWNDVPFEAGALTGISANATGEDTPGWIDVIGVETGAITLARLNEWKVNGEWFPLGVTTGVNTDSYQLPTSGQSQYCPGVWVEKEIGSDTYEFYPNAGNVTATAANIATDPLRGKFIWIAASMGWAKFQNGITGGYLPPAGLKIRIPNIFLNNCVAGTPTITALPHATLGTRYDTATTAAGVITIDKANVNWYISATAAYNVTITNSGIMTALLVSNIATPMHWSNVGIGQEAAGTTAPLIMTLCFIGGSFTDCTFAMGSAATSTVMTLTDILGFTFNNLKAVAIRTKGGTTTSTLTMTRVIDCTWNNLLMGTSGASIATCSGLNFNNTAYYDHPALNTIATNPTSMFTVSIKSQNIKIDGVEFGGLYMNQPYTAILAIAAASCENIILRNLGTYASPVSLGHPRVDEIPWTRVTTTATVTRENHGLYVGNSFYVVVCSSIAAIIIGLKTVVAVPTADTFTFTCLSAGSASGTISYFGTTSGLLFSTAASSAANNVKIQRCYAPHTRTNLLTTENSSKNITLENVFSDYLNAPIFNSNLLRIKNVSGTPPMTASTSCYGTHWFNGYVCDVADFTVDQPWTRVTTTCTVTSVGHSLRTGMTISVITSSAPTGVTLGYRTVTCLTSSTFTFTCLNAGAASGTLSYRVGNGRIGLVMNEQMVETADQISYDAGISAFTSAGTLFMPNIGDQVTFTQPDYVLGQGSSFPIIEAVMAGGTIGNYDITYDIDKNDGNGFSGVFKNLYIARAGGSGSVGLYAVGVSSTAGINEGDYVWGTNIAPNARVAAVLTETNLWLDIINIGTVSGTLRFNGLPSESNLGPATGIKMKWRIKTMIANLTAMSSLYINAESTVPGRAYQYPLDIITLTLTNVLTGSDVSITQAGTDNVLAYTEETFGTSWSYVYETIQNIDVAIYKAGYTPFYIRNYMLSSNNSTFPINQVLDRAYIA